MNFLSSVRSSLVLISVTASAIIFWLSASFWYAAYVQRLDSAQLHESIETEDLLLEVSRNLLRERSLANLLLSQNSPSDGIQLNKLDALHTGSIASFKILEARVDDAINTTSLSNQLAFADTEISSIYKLAASSIKAVIAQKELLLAELSIPLSQREASVKQEIFAQYTSLLEITELLCKGMRFLPRYNDTDLSNLQALRDANWEFSKAFAREIALLDSAVATGRSLSPSELTALETLHIETLVSWQLLKQYSYKRDALAELVDLINDIEDQYTGEFQLIRNNTAYDHNILAKSKLSIEQWQAVENKTTQLFDQLDVLNSEQIRRVTKRVEIRATRNLIIDTVLVLVSLAIGIAVLNIFRKVRHIATHDGLTGLPNRVYFESQLEHDFQHAQQSPIALLFVDLDGFKLVNDTHGHEVGDSLLKEVAIRIIDCVNKRGMVARYGGDEFSVTLTNHVNSDTALELANALVECLANEFLIGNYNLRIGASVGVAYSDEDAATANDLKRNADFAMYCAKSEGRSCVCVFDHELAMRHQAKQELKADLQTAILEGQFELYYQPQVGTKANEVVGLEALIRWQHPTKGFIAPDQFIPLAEQTGQIQAIGDWVLDEACRQTAQWHKSGFGNLQIAVNVCSMQFMRADFIDYVVTTYEKHSLDPSFLELEITESVLVDDVQRVIDNCHRLRELQVKVAIDDFGTGYSSLSYLQELPVDTLKIDRAFVSGLKDAGNKSVAKTIVKLAQSCGLETVAEGVESVEQSTIIRELGCDYIQGYFYSKPVSAAQLPDTIKAINQLCDDESKAA